MATTSTQLGSDWTRIGNDVYRVTGGQLGSKLSKADFEANYKYVPVAQRLNLDIIPQWQAPVSAPATTSQPYVGPYAPSYYNLPNPTPATTPAPSLFSIGSSTQPSQPLTSSAVTPATSQASASFQPQQPAPIVTSPVPATKPYTEPYTSSYDSSTFYAPPKTEPTPIPTTPALNPQAVSNAFSLAQNLPPPSGGLLTSSEIQSTPAASSASAFNVPEQNAATMPTRTFAKIGLDIYETTNGVLKHITEAELPGTGLNVTPDWWNKLATLDINNLSDTNKQLIDRIAQEQWGQPISATKQYTPIAPASSVELAAGETKPLPDKMTNEELDSYTNNKIGEIIYGGGAATDTGAGADTGALGTLGFDPSKLYTGKDSALQAQADKILADLEELKEKDPFIDQTITGMRKSMNDEVGLTGLYNDRKIAQDKINAITNVYENTGSEINGSRNLTQALKARRLEYLNKQQLNILNPLTRNLESINASIDTAEKTVTDRLGDTVTQYNIYRNQVNDIQDSYDKLQGRIDDVSNNARQVMNTLIANPELLKGITQNEIDFISGNGYYPQSLIEKIAKNSGTEVKSFVQYQTSASTKTTYGLDAKGNVVSQFTAPDVSQPSGSANTSQVTVDTAGTQYRITYDQMGNEINRQTIGPSTKVESPTQTRTDFISWLPGAKDLYTKDQLVNIAAMFMPGANVKSDTALMSVIDQYKTLKGGSWFFGLGGEQQTTVDPVLAFNGIIVSPNGERYPARSFTVAELQEAQSLGWTLQSQ